jgi:ABC-type transport system substrate-binding protein
MNKHFLLFTFGLLISMATSLPAYSSSSYDGLWFLGMNTNKDIFGDKNGRLVRQAVNYAIDRQYICKQLVGDDNVPTGVIPKGMDGYDISVQSYPFDPAYSKSLLKKAGYAKNDMRLRDLILIHTDGTMTTKIAAAIRKQLGRAGFSVALRKINYEAQGEWETELSAGKYHLFLMGYKPGVPGSESSQETTAVSLLRPLFGMEGEANFFGLADKTIDALLDRSEYLNAGTLETASILRRINAILQENPVTVNLFYIKKL